MEVILLDELRGEVDESLFEAEPGDCRRSIHRVSGLVQSAG